MNIKSLKNIKAFFFDFGDTLISNRIFNSSGDLNAAQKIIEIFNMDGSASEYLSLAQEAEDYVIKQVTEGKWKQYSNENSQSYSVRLKKSKCKKLVELMGEKPGERTVEAVFRAYLEGTAKADSLFPETIKVLEALKKKYKLGIISNNMIENVTGPVKYHNLKKYFDVIVISAEEEVSKPDPEIFHRALKRIEVSSSQAVMVGDHPIDDVQGAKGIGMKTVWINRYADKLNLNVEPDYIITNLEELMDIVFKQRQANG